MLKIYLLSALRSIFKNRIYTFVNLSCLAIGISGIYLAYILFLSINSSGNGGENKERIFILNNHYQFTDKNVSGKHLPGSITSLLQQRFSAIESTARVAATENLKIQTGDSFISAQGCYSENSLFEIFDFDIEKSISSKYLTPTSVVVSKKLSKKMFGDTNVLNQYITIADQLYMITAVVDEITLGFGVKFDFVLPVENYITTNPEVLNANTFLSYVLLRTTGDYEELSSMIENETFHDNFLKTDVHYSLEPFHNTSKAIKESSVLLGIAAMIMLLITVVNFINLSNARLSLRYREIGLRKVNGASRIQVFFQYITETLTLTFIAAAVAAILTILFLPQVNRIFNPFTSMTIDFSILDIKTSVLLVFTLIVIGILAGIYPAAILSSFKPVRILKSGLESPGRGIFIRRVFILLQYIPAVFVILVALTLYFKFHDQYLLKRVGILENIYALQLNEPSGKTEIDQEIRNLPHVKKTTTCSMTPTMIYENAIFSTDWNNSELTLPGAFILVGDSFFDFFNISLESGSFPVERRSNKILINRALADRLKVNDDLSERLIINRDEYMITGVFDRFLNYENSENTPLVAINITEETQPYYLLQSNADHSTLLNNIEHVLSVREGNLFQLDRLKDLQSKAEQFNLQVSKVIFMFSMGMLLVAGMGILSLSSLMATKKTREAGIRKVHGATSVDIFHQLIKEFIALVLFALIIGILLVHLLLQIDEVKLQFKTIFITVVLTVLTGMLASVYQSILVAFKNPVDVLRHE